MLNLLSASLTALSVLLAVQQTPGPPPPIVDAPGPLGYELRLPPGELLKSYGWDDGARVPFLAARPARIEYGERGLRAHTRLYLPANSLFESALTGATNLQLTNVGFAAGRFGQALSFAPDSYLRIALPPQDSRSNGWTLSFWLRPENGAFGHTLLVLSDALELALQSDARVRVSLLPTGERLTHPGALSAGRWSFLVVSYDPLLTRQMRLFVDGTTVNVPFPSAAPPRLAGEIRIGDLARDGRGFLGAVDDLVLDPLPVSTDGAEHTGHRVPRPGSHRLDLTTNLGLRTVALAAGATRKLMLETTADFELGAFEGAAVENGELRWVPGRWQRLDTLGAPPPRTTHPTVSLGGGRVFVFGGETRDTHLWPMVNTGDTWVLDGATNTWAQVPTAVAPSPRCHVPAAYSPDHDLVLLVGGWQNDGGPGQVYDDTWVYHVREQRWEQRFPTGPALGRSSDHGLVYLPELQRFLLLRGRQSWLYDPSRDVWQLLPIANAITAGGQAANYSFGSSMCALDQGTGLVLVYGGASGPTATVFSDTTALYDVHSNTYTVLDPPLRPSPRVRSGLAFDSRRKRFVLFGGVQDQYSERHDDLWIFDPQKRLWSEVRGSNTPSPRGGYYGMAYDEVADRFVLSCGRNSYAHWLDDTFSLELDDRRPGTALYTFERGGDRQSTWYADVNRPADSKVGFLFRTSESGAEWSPWNRASTNLGRARFVQVVVLLQAGSGGEVPSVQRMGLL